MKELIKEMKESEYVRGAVVLFSAATVAYVCTLAAYAWGV